MRAAVLGRNISGKRFVADGRVNERRGEGGDQGTANRAESTAFLILVRLRRVPFAIVPDGFRFRLRAATRFFDLRHGHPRGDRGESNGAGNNEIGRASCRERVLTDV